MFRFRMTEKDEIFFDMFVETISNAKKAGDLLNDLMKNFTDVHEKINAIEEMEHECDRNVHKTMKQLNRSFVTPIDREDIYSIAKELDNIVDNIESTAHRFEMFNIKSVTEESIKLSDLIVQCIGELQGVLEEMKNMKKSTTLKKKIIEVNRIENMADDVYREAMTKLFSDEKNPIEVIKWNELYAYLENTVDACEDVANMVEGVVMKHA